MSVGFLTMLLVLHGILWEQNRLCMSRQLMVRDGLGTPGCRGCMWARRGYVTTRRRVLPGSRRPRHGRKNFEAQKLKFGGDRRVRLETKECDRKPWTQNNVTYQDTDPSSGPGEAGQ